MNPEHEQAERVWQHTLSQIRITRTRRRRRRLLVPLVSTCLIAAFWIGWQPRHPSPRESVVAQEPAAPPEPTLAVMRLNENGEAVLQELTPSQLGPIELAFGQAPMLQDDFGE